MFQSLQLCFNIFSSYNIPTLFSAYFFTLIKVVIPVEISVWLKTEVLAQKHEKSSQKAINLFLLVLASSSSLL